MYYQYFITKTPDNTLSVLKIKNLSHHLLKLSPNRSHPGIKSQQKYQLINNTLNVRLMYTIAVECSGYLDVEELQTARTKLK